jgi:hypothetical protein
MAGINKALAVVIVVALGVALWVWSLPEDRGATSSRRQDADAALQRGQRVRIKGGTLHVPADFSSRDGRFDLIVHFHGNAALVEQSVALARLNALVHVVDHGDSERPYARKFDAVRSLDVLVTAIEQRVELMGLGDAHVARIALASWGAGQGAVGAILRERPDRVDAVLMMDSLRGSYDDDGGVAPASIRAYVTFAGRAVSGHKLFVLTHSEVETEDLASTARSADALLAALSIDREFVDPAEASPPPVDLQVARAAFAVGEQRWLATIDKVDVGGLYILGCAGDGPHDHVAHLAQMASAVLPRLAARWGVSPEGVAQGGAAAKGP